MNILYVIPSLRKLGPINVCFSLIDNLCKDNNVHVVYLNEYEETELHSNSNCTIKHIPFLNFRQFFRYVKHNDFDVIHSHCLLPDILVSFLSITNKRSFRTYSTIHNYIDVDYVLLKGSLIGRIMGLTNRVALTNIDHRISCSNSVMVYCKKKYDLESTYIRNGINSSHLLKSNKKDDGKIHFFYLGVLNSRKNVELILKSFSNYKNESAILHIVGDGPDLSRLKGVYSSERIVFYGHQDNPFMLINNFDVFISMSLAEGLPLALLESLSLGVPYICSDISPHQEVHHLANCGVIIDPREDMLVSALAATESWDLNGVGLLARQSYEEHFTAGMMSDNYFENYKSSLLLHVR